MSATPLITIFVRHSADCKYKGDEFNKRCSCRKHMRWTLNGVQYRKQAGTRSWQEAEQAKRDLENQLSGRASDTPEGPKTIEDAVKVFLQDKTVQGVTPGVLGKYTRELARLQDYCGRSGVFVVPGVTRELLTGFCATWEKTYPSSYTRAKVRERCRGFLRFCYEAQWLPRIPALPKMKIDEPETLPLSSDEFTRLLKAVPAVVADPQRSAAVRALFQLMLYSGLAIRDAMTLERVELEHDKKKGLYRVVTKRQKTGTHVSVPIPPAIAQELLALVNANPTYFFWSGNGAEESITKSWMKYYIAPIFKAAKITNDGHMMSHRLRDTFAVDLLEKGVPLEEVSKLLGHESIKTTERHYSKWMKGRQDRLDALVTGTWDAAKAK
jgi:integrase/recombinase XerD